MSTSNIYKTLIIANGAEAFKNLINKCSIAKKEIKKCIEHNLCERALFWEEDNKLILTPYPIPAELLNKNIILMEYLNVINISPDNIDISLSEAIFNDKILWKQLVGFIRNNPGIKISPYAFTEEFFGLIHKLKKQNLDFCTNEIPKIGSEWIVSYLDSKSGFRLELLQLQDKFVKAIIPEGFICVNKKQAKKAAEWFFRKNKSCILKTDYGESGWGLILVKHDDFTLPSDINKFIKYKMNIDNIWDNTLSVVEEYIEPKLTEQYYSPSAEIYISDNGFKITYICSQLLGKEGEFKGIILGKDAICEPIKSHIYRISSAVGERYFDLGYRGYFDIDFVISSDNHVYAIETNTRRTGGTHVFDIARRLFPNSWENDYSFYSQDCYIYGKKIFSINALFGQMQNLLFPINNDKKGIIVTHIGRQSPSIGFVIVSPSLTDSRKIYIEFCQLWENNSFRS